MHTAPIRRISVDTAGRFLATASFDKTARVWDLRTGALLQTLRPPVGPGAEGTLLAVALSPDGERVAVGGSTGITWEGTASIYLFERASGRMLRRMSGLQGWVEHLAFTADGKRLAAALSRNAGIRVFDPASGREIGADGDYGDDVTALAYDSRGRLVTSSYDGFVRLYDRDLKRIAKAAVASAGDRLFGVAFSPDGRTIAAGHIDTASVALLSADDLSPLAPPDTQGASGSLPIVAWSASGDRLYAAGTFGEPDDNYRLRIWERGGHGRFRDVPLGATNSIQGLLPLPDGRLVFAGNAPAWGILSRDDEILLFKGSQSADFRAPKDCFKVDDTGERVQFSYQSYCHDLAVFSAARRTVVVGPSPDRHLTSPRTKAFWIVLTTGKDGNTYLNRRPLFQGNAPTVTAIAVAPDGHWFTLATIVGIISLAKDGTERWRVATASPCWAINISGDGRVVVGAFHDGTIRWFRASDGREVLSLYLHGDHRRWIAWTPSGYYDASIGAESLIGWQINRGLDAAPDWFPASGLRDTFYRPDVISRAVAALDEAVAVRQADASAGRVSQPADIARLLPPVVQILSPADGASVARSSLEITASVRSPIGEPIASLDVSIDGRPVPFRQLAGRFKGARGIEAEIEAHPYRLAVEIPPKDCVLAVTASTGRAVSEPAAVHLAWAGPRATPHKARLFILSAGISRYANRAYSLEFADRDARDIAAAFRSRSGALYSDVTPRLLVDAQATRRALLDALGQLAQEARQDDVVLVFLAGHGLNQPSDGEYSFLPYDGDLDLKHTVVLTDRELRQHLSSIHARIVLLLDTCHGGSLLQAGSSRDPADVTRFVTELTAASGVVVFSAAGKNQLSRESPQWQHGAFTAAVLEGLAGAADLDGDGLISLTELEHYVSKRVSDLTGGEQTPVVAKPAAIPDFPLIAAAVAPR